VRKVYLGQNFELKKVKR